MVDDYRRTDGGKNTRRKRRRIVREDEEIRTSYVAKKTERKMKAKRKRVEREDRRWREIRTKPTDVVERKMKGRRRE